MRTVDVRQKERAERVAALLAKSGLKRNEVAARLGAATASVSKWYTGESAPTGARLEALAALLGVSADFIRTGKTAAAAAGAALSTLSSSPHALLSVQSMNPGGRPAALSALTFSPPLLSLLGVPSGAVELYLVDSDAMAPTIPADSIVLVDTSVDTPAARGAFTEGVYLIESAEGVRRLARLIYTPAGPVFISDSPAYRREPVPAAQARIRGRVKALVKVELI